MPKGYGKKRPEGALGVVNFSTVEIPKGTQCEMYATHGVNAVIAYYDPRTGERIQLLTVEEADKKAAAYIARN